MLSGVGLAYVRQKDFDISFDLGLDDQQITEELARAVRRVKTSRMHNMLVLEVAYPVDSMVHWTLEYMCQNGVRSFRWDHIDPSRRSDDTARLGQMSYLYEDGAVIDQYTPSSREDDGDEPMLDVLQINFKRKRLTNRKWTTGDRPQPRLVLVEKPALLTPSHENFPV